MSVKPVSLTWPARQFGLTRMVHCQVLYFYRRHFSPLWSPPFCWNFQYYCRPYSWSDHIENTQYFMCTYCLIEEAVPLKLHAWREWFFVLFCFLRSEASAANNVPLELLGAPLEASRCCCFVLQRDPGTALIWGSCRITRYKMASWAACYQNAAFELCCQVRLVCSDWGLSAVVIHWWLRGCINQELVSDGRLHRFCFN